MAPAAAAAAAAGGDGDVAMEEAPTAAAAAERVEFTPGVWIWITAWVLSRLFFACYSHHHTVPPAHLTCSFWGWVFVCVWGGGGVCARGVGVGTEQEKQQEGKQQEQPPPGAAAAGGEEDVAMEEAPAAGAAAAPDFTPGG